MNSYELENPGIADSSVCFDWDDEIQNDGQEFITLPEGDYVFEVVEFERGRFAGSEKVPACNKANLVLAHRGELLTQAADKLRDGPVPGDTEMIIEKGSHKP